MMLTNEKKNKIIHLHNRGITLLAIAQRVQLKVKQVRHVLEKEFNNDFESMFLENGN